MPDHATAADRIRAEEAESYWILSGRADAGLIVLCDHAVNAFPEGYGTLGLPEAQLSRHIAYDIGAASVTRQISQALDVPAVMARYSRLLIDPNRSLDDPTLISRISDGAVIPGNRRVDSVEREVRLNRFYRPYHRAIDGVVDQCLASGTAPMLLSIHSFTESWKTLARPWHVGVLWGSDERLAKPLLDGFYALGDLIVGENQPYVGQVEGDCLWQHGTQRGLPNAILEIRQDLIRDAAGQAAWAERVCRIVEKILRDTRGERGTRATDETLAAGIPARAHGEGAMTKIDKALTAELEAAAFRRLVQHLRSRTDVQNIDLMNLAGFCRNCLANWYQEAAGEKGVQLTKDGAREVIYGMPYKEWQAKYQKEASPAAEAAFAKAKPHGGH